MSILPETLLRLSETEEVRLPPLPKVNWRTALGLGVRALRLVWAFPFYACGWAVGVFVGAGKLAIAGMIEGYKDGKKL